MRLPHTYPCVTVAAQYLSLLRHTPACIQGWGWSFVVLGLLMIFLGILIFLYLVVQPADVGLTSAVSYDQLRGDEEGVSWLGQLYRKI